MRPGVGSAPGPRRRCRVRATCNNWSSQVHQSPISSRLPAGRSPRSRGCRSWVRSVSRRIQSAPFTMPRGCPRGRLVPGEPEMLLQHPEDPSMVLVVLQTRSRLRRRARLPGTRPRQRDGALVMQPGVQALLGLPMRSASFEVEDHHAGFVAVGAVGERADAGEPPGGVGFPFAIDQQDAWRPDQWNSSSMGAGVSSRAPGARRWRHQVVTASRSRSKSRASSCSRSGAPFGTR